jgi:DNA-binding NtrC family response regulator
MKYKSITIVDDMVASLRLLSHFIKEINSNITIKTFETKCGYLKSNREEDLLILDMYLTDGTGLEIVKELPESKPIIIISSAFTKTQARNLKETEFSNRDALTFIAKPILYSEIKDLLKCQIAQSVSN